LAVIFNLIIAGIAVNRRLAATTSAWSQLLSKGDSKDDHYDYEGNG